MPAYNFKARWKPKLRRGDKRTTIRADRKDGRVPKVGEPFLAYVGMRSKQCRRLFASTHRRVSRIVISVRRGRSFPFMRYRVLVRWDNRGARKLLRTMQVEELALRDGFDDLSEFVNFFLPKAYAKTPVRTFRGWLIEWEPLARKQKGRR